MTEERSFVDYHLLDHLTNIAPGDAASGKMKALMYFNEAWEGCSPAINDDPKDGDIYKAYYRGWNYEIARSEPQVTLLCRIKRRTKWVKPF